MNSHISSPQNRLHFDHSGDSSQTSAPHERAGWTALMNDIRTHTTQLPTQRHQGLNDARAAQENNVQLQQLQAANQENQAAFLSALDSFDFDTIQQLVHLGADVNQTNNEGSTALMLAGAAGEFGRVGRLLDINGIDVDLTNNDNDTALIIAAYNGQVRVVDTLLNVNGINFNHANNNGETALMLASSEGHFSVVQALLNVANINVDSANNDGNTALMLAANEGMEPVVQALLSSGADAQIRNRDGDNAMMMAASANRLNTTFALLRADPAQVPESHSA